MKHFNKIMFTLVLNLTLSAPTYADIVKEKRLNYKFNSELLMKGDIHYSFRLVNAKDVRGQFPVISQLDTLGMLRKPEVKILMSKVVYVINKPIGFFDHKQMVDEKFLGHLSEGSKLKALSEESFQVKGPSSYNYGMKVYFDSDDVSTLPDAKAIKAVTAARKLDVISQSSSAVVMKEYSNFSKFQEGVVTVTSFVPLKENKTLAITYHIAAVKESSISLGLEDLFKEELSSQKILLDNFKVK